MPLQKPKTIAIRISGGEIRGNTPVYLFNRNTGDRWTVYTKSTDDGMIALADLGKRNSLGNEPTAWVKNHVIEVLVIGLKYGSAIITLDAQQDQEVTITEVDEAGSAISI